MSIETKNDPPVQQREFSSDVFLPFITPNCACCSSLSPTTTAGLPPPPQRHHSHYHHHKTQSLPVIHHHPPQPLQTHFPVVPIRPQPPLPLNSPPHHQHAQPYHLQLQQQQSLRRPNSQQLGSIISVPFSTAPAEPSSLPLNTFGTYGSPSWQAVHRVGSTKCLVVDNNVGHDEAIDSNDDDGSTMMGVVPELPSSRPPSRLPSNVYSDTINNGSVDQELSALSNMTLTSTTTEC